jgi:hypothetical protein
VAFGVVSDRPRTRRAASLRRVLEPDSSAPPSTSATRQHREESACLQNAKNTRIRSL